MSVRKRRESCPVHREAPEGFSLSEVEVRLARPEERPLWDALMDEHHCLGFRRLAGRGLRYDATFGDRWLGLAAWQNGAFKCRPRDRWTGWKPEQQFRRLEMVANNTRFLILSEPGVFPNLASRFLAGMTRRLAGDWITPQFDYGVPFWGKPPLHTWLSAFGMKIFGVGPFGARIFILGTSLGVLGLIFTWVRQHRGADQALMATTVLASSVMFFGASAFVMTDMVLVLGTTLSMVAFYNCLTGDSSSLVWGRLFFVGIAIGLLAKGPVALVLTIIPIVPWSLMGGRWRRLNALPWASGLLIAAVLTLPWYVAAESRTPGFLRYFVIGEHFERFAVPGWQGDLYGAGHAEPKGIIWLYGLATFLPWTVFAVALLPRAKALLVEAPRGDQGWHSYLAFLALSPLVMFTLAANILAAYVLPGLPAASVLLVSLWTRVWDTPGKMTRIAVTTAVGGLAASFLTLTVLAHFLPGTLDRGFARDLVAAAQSIDPDAQITYWGKRSYAAEFHTQGRARFTNRTATFDTLAGNGMRDAVVIPQATAVELAPFLETGFDRIGQFGQRVLFIENSAQEDAS